jgi:hypothetical protein
MCAVPRRAAPCRAPTLPRAPAAVPQGTIDQVEGLIYFDDKLEPLLQWDLQIQAVCGKVNDIIDAMGKAGIKAAV